MRVFIGMPAYNTDPIIATAIKSTYDYVEKIVVVDGSKIGPSTDKTVEEAKSVGPKVEVKSGTFIHPTDGSWGEQIQRQLCIDMLPKGFNHWCIFQDADEVFDTPEIERLIDHMRKAGPKTMMFSFGGIHFYRDPQHIVVGGQWSRSHARTVCAFRLIPEVQMLCFNRIGTRAPNPANWALLGPPLRVTLDDVFFYHYGHILSYGRTEFKAKQFVEQGLFISSGYQKNEWERMKREKFVPAWNRRYEVKGCIPYEGDHPAVVHPILKRLSDLWKRYDGS